VWQLALLLDFRMAFAATLLLVVIMGIIQCEGETRGKLVLVVATCAGLQFFAMCAAQLVRSEIIARHQLARVNSELQATQAILREGARLSERLRIARDLHDTVGHSLTTLSVHLDVATRLTDGPAAEHVVLARSVAGDLLNQVRDVVSRFRIEPLDLRAALEKLADGAQGLDVTLRLGESLTIADTATAEAIVHCVQETITNTLRHAQAHKLRVEIREESDALVVETLDDGLGGPFRPGNGLKGMRERFENLGGTLTFASSDHQGFRIEGVLPITKDAS
jgi:signal transduction histidine kinase